MMMLLKRNIISRLSLPLASARSVEEVTRSVLAMQEIYTGFESGYFAAIDVKNDTLEVRYVYNNEETLKVPQGSVAPWVGSLCKAVLENPHYEATISALCETSHMARGLGIKTLAGNPIYRDDGTLYGMLCAASSKVRPITKEIKLTLGLFGKLIAHQVQREMLFKAIAGNMRKTVDALIEPELSIRH